MGRGKENLNKRGDNLGARNGSSASKKPKSGGCHRCGQTSRKRRNRHFKSRYEMKGSFGQNSRCFGRNRVSMCMHMGTKCA